MDLPSPAATHRSLSQSDDTEFDKDNFTNLMPLDPDCFLPMPMDLGMGYGLDMDYLGISNMDIESTPQWPQTCAPSDLVAPTPEFNYQFTFDPSTLDLSAQTLPSPPSSTTGTSAASSNHSDPPSPVQPHKLPVFTTASLAKLSQQSIPPVQKRPVKAVAGTPTNPRPKTSHTTIERRYRTNLNARIIALRLAVPALRVLDKSLPPPETPDQDVDDRGYVDGVKAAKKNSKATILGKATEYIMVLKRREQRLTMTVDSLRSLILSLLPPEEGPNFLMAWESEHIRIHGDARSDELPESERVGDDDEEEEDEEKEFEGEKPLRKKIKKEPVPSTIPPATESVGIEPPVKRKRGRPRKVHPLPAAAVEDVKPLIDTQPLVSTTAQTPQRPATYLLATFAFFSLFGSHHTSYSYPNDMSTSDGSVLTPLSPTYLQSRNPWIPHEFVSAVQLITSLLLLFSLVKPYLPVSWFGSSKPSAQSVSKHASTDLLASSYTGLAKEYMRHFVGRMDPQESLAWSSCVKRVINNGELAQLPFVSRIRLYYALCHSDMGSGEVDAAIARSLLRSTLAFHRTGPRMASLGVQFSGEPDEAMTILADPFYRGMTLKDSLEHHERLSRMTRAAKHVFVDAVVGDVADEAEFGGLEDQTGSLLLSLSREDLTPESCKENLARLKTRFSIAERDQATDRAVKENDIEDLIHATLLVGCLFSQTLVDSSRATSTKTSSTAKALGRLPAQSSSNELAYELRCILGRCAFEGGKVEEARDVLVSLLEGC